MSALDMTPEQVATFVSRTKEDFAHYSPEVTPNSLCTDLRCLGYAATMGNLQAVYTALVEAAKPHQERLVPFQCKDVDGHGLSAGLSVRPGRVRVAAKANRDDKQVVDLTAAQLRQLATWSLGAADHLDGVEPPGSPHSLAGCGSIGESAAYAALLRAAPVNLSSAEARQAARKLLELADAHDAGGAA